MTSDDRKEIKLRGNDPPRCQRCGAPLVVRHLLCECPILANLRRTFDLPDDLKACLNDPHSIERVLSYLRVTVKTSWVTKALQDMGEELKKLFCLRKSCNNEMLRIVYKVKKKEYNQTISAAKKEYYEKMINNKGQEEVVVVRKTANSVIPDGIPNFKKELCRGKLYIKVYNIYRLHKSAYLIDRIKTRRQRQKVRETIVRTETENLSPLNETTSYRKTVTEEHYVLVQEPASEYVAPLSESAANIKLSIVSFLERQQINISKTVALGCDGTAVNTGQKDGVLRDLGKQSHSRWLTTANRLLRLYIGTESPSKNLKMLAEYIFGLKSSAICLARTTLKNLFELIKRSRCLSLNLKTIIDPLIQRNGFPCHTQAVDRCVKLVTEASSAVCDKVSRDGFVRARLESRKSMPKFDTKAQYATKVNFLRGG
nr:unnamed protein product [Callosobruchus analis]